MISAFLLILGVHASGAAPEFLARALEAAQRPGWRVEVVRFQPGRSRCTPREVALPELDRSGAFPVRLFGVLADGSACAAWGTLTVRVFGPAWRMRRTVQPGEPLEGAVEEASRERLGTPVLERLAPGARARTRIVAGAWLSESHLEDAAALPEAFPVRVQVGALMVEQTGRRVPCGRGRSCARLPSGKTVEGAWTGERLEVGAR